MSIAPIILDETSSRTSQGNADDLDHIYCCCTPHLGICGTDISDQDEVDGDEELEHPCVVCVDLETAICHRCGYGVVGPCACGKCGAA